MHMFRKLRFSWNCCASKKKKLHRNMNTQTVCGLRYNKWINQNMMRTWFFLFYHRISSMSWTIEIICTLYMFEECVATRTRTQSIYFTLHLRHRKRNACSEVSYILFITRGWAHITCYMIASIPQNVIQHNQWMLIECRIRCM